MIVRQKYLGVCVTALGAVALHALATRANADVVIRTVPEQTNWIADGTTVYRMEVRASTDEEPNIHFYGVDWAIAIPDALDFVSSEFPSPNDPSGPLVLYSTEDEVLEGPEVIERFINRAAFAREVSPMVPGDGRPTPAAASTAAR